MERQELEAEILAGLGGRLSTDESILLSVGGSDYNLVHKWIYRAMRRIARKYDFAALHDEDTSLETTADDATPIDLPANTKYVRAIRIIDGTSSRKLTYKPPAWFDRWHPNPGGHASGKPRIYTIKAGAFRFIPVPDDDYTLYVDRMKWPTRLDADDDTPDFGDDLVDDVIIEYAIAYGFTSFGETYKKDATYHFSVGDMLLREAYVSDDYSPDFEPVPDGYLTELKRSAYNALDANSFPDGVAYPFI